MEPCGTQALAGYSCQDSPFRITWSCLSLEKDKAKYLTQNSLSLSFVEEKNMSNLVKNYGSSATSLAVSELLKVVVILSERTVRKSSVDQNTWNNTRNQKKAIFL